MFLVLNKSDKVIVEKFDTLPTWNNGRLSVNDTVYVPFTEDRVEASEYLGELPVNFNLHLFKFINGEISPV